MEDLGQGYIPRVIEQELDIIRSSVNEFLEESEVLSEQMPELADIRERAEKETESVNAAVRELEAQGSREAALRAVTAIQSLGASFSFIDAQLSMQVTAGLQAIGSAWAKVKAVLQSAIHSLSTHLWQLISHLLSPTGWSVSGQLGTSVLGLASVQLQVTFR